jgi:ABC-type glycerol-3-phosphate transport system permease component
LIRSRDKERGFTVKLIPLVQFLSRIGLYGRISGLVVVHVIYCIPINLQPITVALQNLAGSQIVEWYVQMAGALLAALLIYIILGKFFIRGLLARSGSSST